MSEKKAIEKALLKATFDRIHVERELGEACERPADKPGFLDEGYDEWRATPEYAALLEAEQKVRLRVYAADERWQEAADAYYESCFEAVS